MVFYKSEWKSRLSVTFVPCELPFFHLNFFHFAMVDGKDDPQQGIETTPAEGIEVVHNQDRKVDMGEYENKQDISHVEKVLSESDDLVKDNMDITRVDKEIQAYAAHSQVDIDEETNKRLKKLIDRRVLVVMICTYFLQALDKGTMSFAAIMGIKDDAHLNDGQKVCNTCCAFSSINILSLFLSIVLLVDYVYLHRSPCRRISHKLDHPKSPTRQILGPQHHPLGYDSGTPCSLQEFHWVGHRSYPPGYL